MPCEPGYCLAPGHVAEESITATADGLRDGRETSGRGDHVIADKLVPFAIWISEGVDLVSMTS